jgi:hypothetical protein
VHGVTVFAQSVGPVGARAAEVLIVEVQTICWSPAQAVRTFPARGEAQDNVVPRLHLANALADPLDGPRTLVSEHGGQRHRVPLVPDDHVRVTYPRGDDTHQHLIRPRLLELEILDGEGLRFFVYYRGGYLQVNNTSRALPYTLEKYPTLLSPQESNDRRGRVRLLRPHGAAAGSSNRTRDPGL